MSQRSSTRDFIQDMLDSCRKIQQFTYGKSESEFLNNVMMQYAVVRGLEIVGEAAKQFRDEVPDAATRFPGIPFREVYITRNRLIHGYVSVGPKIVWRIIDQDIPGLIQALESALDNWPADLT